MDLGPLNQLRLRTPRLELRIPGAEELLALAEVARAGIHPPDEMPFLAPWTDPSPTFVADFLAFHQGLRDTWRPETWNLELAVLAGGQPLGFQGVRATDFASRRSVRSGSWLGQRFQGQGYGTEMRAAVLHFAFVGLGAVEAATEAMDFNLASQRVSEKLGYTYDDEAWPVVRDRPQRAFNYHLTRDAFLSRPYPAVEIEGLEHCLSLFGADG